ncbi:peptide arginase family protein [Paenibacillus vandeheii]
MRAEWEQNIHWRVRTNDKRITIMRNHNWAFGAWELARLDGEIKSNSLLVHVDSHLDDSIDGLLLEGLMEADNKEQILELSKGFDYLTRETPDRSYMKYDNFIWPSLARETIGEIIFVSRDKKNMEILEELKKSDSPESTLILSKLPLNFEHKYQRYTTIEEFLQKYDGESFLDMVSDRTAILDLDIDVFNSSDDYNMNPDLRPPHEVRELTEELLKLYPWDLITIAISPEYCGGVLEAEMLLENVVKVLKIDLNKIEHIDIG